MKCGGKFIGSKIQFYEAKNLNAEVNQYLITSSRS